MIPISASSLAPGSSGSACVYSRSVTLLPQPSPARGQQSKAGDVCAGVRACIYNLFTSAVIERGHAGDQSGIVLLRHQPSLRSCGQNSSAQRLCQNQHVTGLCSYVFQNFVRMDEAGHTKAIFGLLVLNGVSSGHYAASFHLPYRAHPPEFFGCSPEEGSWGRQSRFMASRGFPPMA